MGASREAVVSISAFQTISGRGVGCNSAHFISDLERNLNRICICEWGLKLHKNLYFQPFKRCKHSKVPLQE